MNLLQRKNRTVFACGVLCLLSYAAHAQETSERAFETAAVRYEQGAFAQAIAAWREAISAAENANLELRAHLGIAAASLQIGMYRDSQDALLNVERLLRNNPDTALAAQYHRHLGNLNMAASRHAEALEHLSTASQLASDARQPALRAAIFNDYGNALAVSGYATDALSAYDQAHKLASELQLSAISLSAATNIVRVQAARGEMSAARTALQTASNEWRSVTPSFSWAMSGFALIDRRREIDPASSANAAFVADTLARVEAYATQTRNPQLSAQVHLYLGETQGETALRKAVFFAAQARAPEVLYEAHWRLAQSLRSQGKLDEAIQSFEQALTALGPIRDELLNGYRDTHSFFQSRVRPVYSEFAATLMEDAVGADSRELQRAGFERARNAIEALRGAELQDYFRDECVVERQSKSMSLEQAGVGAAILYPIVLEDRVELLLAVDGELQRFAVDAPQGQVTEAALRLREFAQDDSHDRYMPYASRLYRWLIAPVKPSLVNAGVETLVIVPDGVLRSIPFGALHSGDRYLIEEFAVAVTPGLTLTAASRATAANSGVLLAGIAQSVQGFAPLPQVRSELRSIHDRVGGRVLTDRDYTKANVKAALETGNYNIVHLATHGTVGATPAESFLLTYDGRLSMGDLEELLRIGEFRERNIDLLTLSACETAIGDERAALGLAGIAVKSGAASVVASLWRVDDAATAVLMDRFYQRLRDSQSAVGSKASALRAAQLGLLGDVATAHPAHWAAFTLIGNWQ